MMKYIQTGNYDATELDGEWIILNTDQFTVTKLNEMGGFCWSLLNKVQTSETLAQSVIEKFPSNENAEQIRIDMEEFLANLQQCGLIQHVNG